KEIHRFAEANNIPVVHFKKGESKEAEARPLIEAAAKEGGDGKVVLIGIAQEKASVASVWRSWPSVRRGHAIRTWSGAARWPSSTTPTSTSGIRSGGRRSSRPTP